MRELSLIILFNNDATEKLNDLEIDCELEMYDEREMIFYDISAIAPRNSEDREYTEIFSGGHSFICCEPYDTVRMKISECRKS